MNTVHHRRFIAGATCPECQQVDKLFLLKENGVERIECVRCHYSQERPKNIQEAVHETAQGVVRETAQEVAKTAITSTLAPPVAEQVIHFVRSKSHKIT